MNKLLDTSVQSEKLYDLSLVEKICRGNIEILRKMIQTFLSTIPSAIDEIKLALNRMDFETIKKTTHRIKPTLAIYAVVKIEKDILRIEELAKNETGDNELRLKIGKVDEVVTSIVCAMKNEFLIG